jgi:hypothetical protein
MYKQNIGITEGTVNMLIKQRKTKSRVGQNDNIQLKQKQGYIWTQNTEITHESHFLFYNINYKAQTAVHCLVFTSSSMECR